MPDFFVSYTGADRAWAEWIAWELEAHGYETLVQAWDMVPSTNWVDVMHRGVRDSERTIAVLSAAYLDSAYGTAEWQAAWRDDPVGGNRKLVVLRVEDCDRPGLLGSIVSEDLFGIDERASRKRLIRAVRGAKTGRLKPAQRPDFPGRPAPSFPGTQPSVWNVPLRNPNFTGRIDSLEQLHQAIRSDSTVAVYSLRGMGGVGKTQLAIEYAHRFASDFDVVWWIPAEQPALIAEHLCMLGAALGMNVDPSKITQVLAALRGRPRWLVIFDNAEDPSALRPYLPSGPGSVVITTRRNGFAPLGAVLNLDILDRAESIALLQRRVPAASADEVSTLAELLGDLPLAIEQAAGYLETTGLPVDDYVTLFRERAAEMISRGQVVDRQERLTTLWDLSLTALAEHNPAAVQLLDLLARMAPEPVPLDLFTKHPDELPDSLAAAARDPLIWAETVGALVDRCFAHRTSTEITIVHRLLQQSMQARDDWDSGTTVAVQDLIAADLSSDVLETPETWQRWRLLLPHILAAATEKDGQNVTSRGAWLLDRAAGYLRTTGRPADALPLLERALDGERSASRPDNARVADYMHNLGNVLRDLGRPDDALPLFEEALKITEGTYGPEHPRVAISLNGLGSVLWDLRRDQAAYSLLKRSLAVEEALYGPDDPRVATSLNDLGTVLSTMGRTEDARDMLEQALTMREATFGADHPHVASTLINLSNVLRGLGRLEHAQRCLERALGILEATFGRHHPHIAIGLESLGILLDDLGHHHEAQAARERARNIRERYVNGAAS